MLVNTAGRGVIHVCKGTISTVQNFWSHFIISKYKDITKMNQSLMVFMQEIVYQRRQTLDWI